MPVLLEPQPPSFNLRSENSESAGQTELQCVLDRAELVGHSRDSSVSPLASRITYPCELDFKTTL